MSRGKDNVSDASYLFPEHPSEFDRLDVQHHFFKAALGAHYLAPVKEPRRVLDVGSGSGQWGFEVCAKFPAALVVGFDLSPGKPGPPPGYRFVRGNVLHGLPFESGAFDFVHQRLLSTGVPLKSWSGVVRDLLRVTRPGGWVELGEVQWGIEPAGPATNRLLELTGRLGRSLGLDTTGIIFNALDEYLRREGCTDIGRRDITVGVGEWAGRSGSLMASDLRSAFSRLATVFRLRFGVTDEESSELIATAMRECDERHSACSYAFAFGRRPG
jgi:SAM-dependent methyltransferase